MEFSAVRECRGWDSIAKVKIRWWLSPLPICSCLNFHVLTTFEITALHSQGTEYRSECLAMLQTLPGGS